MRKSRPLHEIWLIHSPSPRRRSGPCWQVVQSRMKTSAWCRSHRDLIKPRQQQSMWVSLRLSCALQVPVCFAGLSPGMSHIFAILIFILLLPLLLLLFPSSSPPPPPPPPPPPRPSPRPPRPPAPSPPPPLLPPPPPPPPHPHRHHHHRLSLSSTTRSNPGIAQAGAQTPVSQRRGFPRYR